jgi:Zn-dependent peptidase ImmA (M78 family)/DNA-binding XRE family transcriptional regulator
MTTMEENILDKLDMKKLGRELQLARTKRGLTQADVAQQLDMARTTITAIEKGERHIKPMELIKLARIYGKQVSDFVRERPQIESFQVQFRGPYMRDEGDDDEISQYIDELEELARNYLELEKITNSPFSPKYPKEYSIDGLRADVAAEDVAYQERKRLGLGDGPIIQILRELLEQDVGLRIFYLKIKPAKYSAMYFYNDELGGCMGINLDHPEERRRWSLAHEYGHFLAHRHKASMVVMNHYQRLPQSEQFADSFAACFLMPRSGLTMRFNDLRKTKEKMVVGDLCTLAHFYGVSVQALTIRLEDLRLIPTGTWDRIKDGGFKVQEAKKQLGLGEISSQNDPLPIRYQTLAVIAYDKELITEGQMAQYLRIDRVLARDVAENLRRHISQTSENNNEIVLDLTESINF